MQHQTYVDYANLSNPVPSGAKAAALGLSRSMNRRMEFNQTGKIIPPVTKSRTKNYRYKAVLNMIHIQQYAFIVIDQEVGEDKNQEQLIISLIPSDNGRKIGVFQTSVTFSNPMDYDTVGGIIRSSA
jgi:hypothetical protein